MAVHYGRILMQSCRSGKSFAFHKNVSRHVSKHLPISTGNQRWLREVNAVNCSKQTQQIRKVHGTSSCYSFDEMNGKSGGKRKTVTIEEVVIDAMSGKYRVSYVDEGDKSKPVILCLHGMPANHKDFLAITPALLNGGTRVILPNFPCVGLSWQLEGVPYDYTNPSKAKIIEALLAHLGINKVDMLVSHCSSGHSGMELCANTDLIENVTFICPISHLPHGHAKKTFLLDVFYYALSTPFTRALLGPFFLKLFSRVYKVTIPEVEILYGLACEAKSWNWEQAKVLLTTIKEKDMSVIVLAARKDPIVQLHVSKNTMDLLGITQENRVTYTEHGKWQPADRGSIKPLKHGVIFEKSTHWIQKSHPHIVADLILDFLKATRAHKP